MPEVSTRPGRMNFSVRADDDTCNEKCGDDWRAASDTITSSAQKFPPVSMSNSRGTTPRAFLSFLFLRPRRIALHGGGGPEHFSLEG